MMNTTKGILLGLTALISSASMAGSRSTLKVMAYNVQNLFDTIDSADTNDVDFTPNGAQKWTEQILNDKIANLTQVISNENPDILGVEELENPAMLERLQKSLKNFGYEYAYAGPSADGRGIRCGVISKYPIVATTSHQVWRDSWINPDRTVQKTRDVLEVTIDVSKAAINADSAVPMADVLGDNISGAKQQLVTLLVNHWPSRGGGPEREVFRLDVAKQQTELVKSILTKNPDRLLVSVGDFNDELQSPSFVNGLMMTKSYEALASAPIGSVYPSDLELGNLPGPEKGTFYFARDKVWNSLDHVLIARGADLLSGKARGFEYQVGSTKPVHPKAFMGQGIFPTGCEIRDSGRTEQAKNRCGKGSSDHFPITASFYLN